MSIAKEALGLNKGEFQKKLGVLLTLIGLAQKLSVNLETFSHSLQAQRSFFSKVANEPGVEVRLKNMKIGPRKVKCIHLKAT